MKPGEVRVEDGVAVSARGDVFLVVYQKAARLHRTRWLFARVAEYLGQIDGSLTFFMVVLPSADPPDGPTRAENAAQVRRHEARTRRIVTVAIGTAFRASLVRTIMRALAAIQGKSGVHFVSDTIVAGLRRVHEVATEHTPPSTQLFADVRALYTALGETMDDATPSPF